MLTKIRVPIPQATSQPQGQRKRVASPASCRRRTRSHGWATLLFRSGHVDRGALQPAQAAKTEDTRGALRNKGLADSSSRAIHDQSRSRPNAANTRQRPSPSPQCPSSRQFRPGVRPRSLACCHDQACRLAAGDFPQKGVVRKRQHGTSQPETSVRPTAPHFSVCMPMLSLIH